VSNTQSCCEKMVENHVIAVCELLLHVSHLISSHTPHCTYPYAKSFTNGLILSYIYTLSLFLSLSLSFSVWV
jgi:hypothetical protein